MEEIKKRLFERENYLSNLKKEKERAIRNAVEGRLRISHQGNRTQYFYRSNPKDIRGAYIKDKAFAKKLAQDEYDRKIIDLAEKELNSIHKFLHHYPKKSVEEIYESLHQERQKLILPIQETEEQFVKKWLEVPYQGKGFSEEIAELYTARGERVRSKSEVIIADYLEREGIPYRYECPLHINRFGIIYPDFTVLNVRKRKDMYWEHFGMMDDYEYAEKAIQKIHTYEQDGYFQGENLILTFETRKNPLNQKTLRRVVEHYLK